MSGLAYLFERFPAFTQTFCYREVDELRRQGIAPAIFSIRRPTDERPQDWDPSIVRQIEYLPGDDPLVREVDDALRKGSLPQAAKMEIQDWGRKTDFLRLYQAAYLGPRLQTLGIRHVHAHFAGLAARTAYWIERFFGIGFSFTGHANDIFAPKPFEISLVHLVGAARAVVTVSEFGVRFLQEKHPAQAAKISCIYNGIDLAPFRRADLAKSPPGLISVGRLIEKKGFADLIEACRLLRERGIEFRCEIIGEGPLEGALRAQIITAGLTNTVLLTGPLPQAEVIERLAASHLFVLPCVTEVSGGMDNLPTVLMEAMAAELPVVSTALAGVPEMVQEGVTGLLVPEHQPLQLADAVARIMGDREFSRSLGQAGRERAEERFSIEKNAQALNALFRRFGLE
ncbi:MAG: glycosyltransferase family 4 protein [Verrucomicrobiota bacterium]|nr:glycosyltransferase family 4 protein [Verrucomicrobiota bacterium]